MRIRPPAALLAAGTLGTAFYFALDAGDAANLVYQLVGLAALAAVLVGIHRHQPRARAAWYLLAGGLGLFLVGDAIWAVYDSRGVEVPFPSLADVAYLAGYPVLAASLVLFIRRRLPGRDVTSLCDGLIVAASLAVFAWTFLVVPYVTDPSLGLVDKAVSVAYPAGDLLLLVLVARLAAGPGTHPPALRWLVAGLALTLAADAFYAWAVLEGTYQAGGLLDLGWLVAYLFFAGAALHPSMRTLTEPAEVPEPQLSARRLTILTGAALGSPLLLLWKTRTSWDVDVPIIAAASVLFLLVTARMWTLTRTLAGAIRREQALRRAGEAFVAASGVAEVGAALGAAAEGLLGDQASAVVVARRAGGRLISVARSDPTGWPAGLELDGLLRQGAAALESAPPAGKPAVTALALPVRGETPGALVVATDRPLEAPLRRAMEALAAQACLTLEAMLLTEDLHRRRGEERLAALVRHASDVIVVAGRTGRLTYVSPSVERMLGVRPEDLIGTPLLGLVHDEDAARVAVHLDGDAGRNLPRALSDVRVRTGQGTWRIAETVLTDLTSNPAVGGVVLTLRDVTERRGLEEELRHQAFHDSLTGLANRALFVDRVAHALSRRSAGAGIAVLLCDLDDFKTINDTLDHDAGDQVLRETALRLQQCLRPADTCARLEGDEFGILIEDIDLAGAEAAAQRLVDALRVPVLVAGRTLYVSASAGLFHSEEPVEATSALRNADLAMYVAKSRGKRGFAVFEATQEMAARRRLELRSELQQALERDELVLHFQPIVSLVGRRTMSLEALLRWEHPVLGLIPPAEFVPIAEETGLIVPIGRWVLGEACRHARRWIDSYPDRAPDTISVNVSIRQLEQPDFAAHMADALARAGLPPSRLTVEITESVLTTDADTVKDAVTALHDLGVRLAIDDFGTGYSSIGYLSNFPVHTVKIDRSFVSGMMSDPRTHRLVAAVIDMAHALDLETVAEGVETPDQLSELVSLACEGGQGYYFARPLDPAATDAFLLGHHLPAAALADECPGTEAVRPLS